MTISFFLKYHQFNRGGSNPAIAGLLLRKKKKKKKTALQKLDDVFGTNKPGYLELMDDDYNQKVKLILLTLLMEDDD